MYERDALEAIAAYPEMEQAHQFCKKFGLYFTEMEPPYLTMARIAHETLKMSEVFAEHP